jgi:hypothetical protein
MANYADLTNLTDILKYVYGEGLTNQFNDEKTTYNLFPKTDRKPAGLGFVGGIRYARAQSTGARAESAKLPPALTGQKDQFTINARYIYDQIELSGPAIETAKGNVAAFVDSLSDEMDDHYQSVIVQLNRMAWGDGFGLLGTSSAAATPSTSATWTVTFDNDTGVRYFQPGMLVDVFNAAGTSAITTCCGQRVSSITPSTKTVTFAASGQTYLASHPNSTIAAYTNDATQLAAGVIFVAMGSRLPTHAASDTPYEMMGLNGIFDDGTLLSSFEGITVASYPMWAGSIIANSGVNRPVTLDLMLQACDLAQTLSGKRPTRILMGLGQRRQYANLLMPDVRFMPGQLKGGYEVLTFSAGDGNIEILVDPVAQANSMWFHKEGDIMKYELLPLGFGTVGTRPGGSPLNWVQGYDLWSTFLRIYTNLGVEQRNDLVKLTDLTEPTLFT